MTMFNGREPTRSLRALEEKDMADADTWGENDEEGMLPFFLRSVN
jgi:hypothetical protein